MGNDVDGTPSAQDLLARIDELERILKGRQRRRVRLSPRVGIVLGLVLALSFAPALASLAGATTATTFWKLTGNVVAGTQFIGSTNCKPFVMKTNGTEAMRLLAGHGTVANCNGNVTPGVQVAGTLNALGGLQENGTALSSAYLKLNGSNAPGGGMPIDITGNAGGFTGNLAGDVTGTQGSTTVSKLGGVALSSSTPHGGDVLTYDGTQWAPNASVGGRNPLQVALLKWYTNTLTTFQTGNTPDAVVFDGTHMWVANNGGGTVTELNASDGGVVRTPNAGRTPQGLAYDGTHIWVTNYNYDAVTELNASDGSPVGGPNVEQFSMGSGAHPYGVVFDGTYIWVTNAGANTVQKLNPSTGAPVGSALTGFHTPEGIVFDGSHIWVANGTSQTVTELDPSTGQVLNTISAGAPGLAFDGSHIWVTDQGSHAVTRLNASDPTTGAQSFSVGASPTSIVFDGSHIWVTNFGGNNVTELNAADGSLVQTVTVGSFPMAAAFDGSSVWVANYGSHSVSKL